MRGWVARNPSAVKLSEGKLTASLLVQWGERRSAEREVMGSNLDQTYAQGLYITEMKVLPL